MTRPQKTIFIIALALLVTSVALPVSAGLLDLPQFQDPCDVCEFARLLSEIKNIIFEVAAPAALLFIIIGGVMFSASAGVPNLVKRAKTIITSAIIGLVILICAWLIVSAVMAATLGKDIGSNWWTVTCPEDNQCKYQAGQPGNPPTTPVTPPSRPPSSGAYGCQGTACGGTDSHIDICGSVAPPGGSDCGKATINTYEQSMRDGADMAGSTICPGVDTVTMLKAIMFNESGGSHSAENRTSGAAGPYQMLPSTANSHASQCGVTETITADWLKTGHDEQQACLATKILQSAVGHCGCDVRQLAAGYNGGGGNQGACDPSANCGTGAGSGACQACSGQATRRWECLWDDNAHTQCNADRSEGNYSQTRQYAPQVNYCYQYFSGT